MKAKIRLILILTFIITGSFHSYSQKHKIGYINVQELWAAMPEKVEADSLIKVHTDKLNEYFAGRVQDYNLKYTAFMSDSSADKGSLLYKERQNELKTMKAQVEEFRVKAEQEIQQMKNNLYEPIRAKMQAAIDKVAEKNGYDYILDSAPGNIVYARGDSNNIIDLVKKELGL